MSVVKPVYFLDEEIGPKLLSSFGGKASKLNELLRYGFPVPAGIVITSPSEIEVDKIGGFPVAVRSSCSMEDLPTASFAGLYETYLNVNSRDELWKSINDCFESRNTQRVKDYLESKGLPTDTANLQMGVLVQKMVDSKVSGVLFTLNPVNGREEEFYIEYCEGLGERLVSGHVTPTTCRYNISTEEVVEQVVNSEKTLLEESVLVELCRLAREIQAVFGSPQDIEWAIDGTGKLWILQSRPVTTFTPRDDVPELTNADFKDGGVSARVCTRMMFSLYRNALEVSMGEYFQKINLIPNVSDLRWIHYYYGRVYWNAGAVKEGLKRIPGFNEADFDRDLGIQKDYGPGGPHKTKLGVGVIVGAVPILLGLYREFTDCETMVNQFRDSFEFRDELLKERLIELKKLSDKEFSEWFKEVIQFQCLTERNYFRTIYNNSNYQTEFKSFLKKQKAYREGDELELMTGLTGVTHLDVQSDLDKLSKVSDLYGIDSSSYHKAREDFLRSHYHHGPAELDITVPRWGEKKDWVDDLVKANQGRQHASHNSYSVTKERISSQLGYFARSKFSKMLGRSRSFLKSREEMRSYSTRAYYLVRLGLLEFGRRHSISTDLLFMLDIDDVKQMLGGGITSPNLPQRLLHYRGFRNFSAPNEFGGSIKWNLGQTSEGHLKGIGCSPGEIVGVARVILDIHQTTNLSKSEILITTFTDPGWTPVLARVGGVVTEVGGLLSHAAVIGREYGIPAVLNLHNATKLIPDGAQIKVNGKTGIVEILEKRPD